VINLKLDLMLNSLNKDNLKTAVKNREPLDIKITCNNTEVLDTSINLDSVTLSTSGCGGLFSQATEHLEMVGTELLHVKKVTNEDMKSDDTVSLLKLLCFALQDIEDGKVSTLDSLRERPVDRKKAVKQEPIEAEESVRGFEGLVYKEPDITTIKLPQKYIILLKDLYNDQNKFLEENLSIRNKYHNHNHLYFPNDENTWSYGYGVFEKDIVLSFNDIFVYKEDL